MKRLFTFATPRCRELESSSQCKRNSLVRMMLMAIAMMMLAPSAVKGATTEMNFYDAGIAASNALSQANKYEANIVMSDKAYNAIGGGAMVGSSIDYRYNSSAFKNVDISRLAFIVNTNGVGNNHVDGDGYYLRYAKYTISGTDYRVAGLYSARWGQKLAVLNLKPGDIVKFTYGAAEESYDQNNNNYNANLHNDTYDNWLTQVTEKGRTVTSIVDITHVGDLIVSANKGTFIQSIVIESNAAEYEITTSGNATTFKFTRSGSLEENDYAIPFLSASFGSINDYLVVQNLEAHMYNSEGNEDLKTQGVNFQPSAGSFYAFKPTSSGTISVKGSLQGEKIHVFVYNPALGTVGDWDEKVQGNFYRDTFTSGEFSFGVVKDKIYYICQDNNNESGNAFHLSEFTFTHAFKVEQLAKIVDLEKDVANGWIQLTKIEGAGGHDIKVKRCTGNISPSIETKIEHDYLYMKEPQFTEGTDNAGTVIFDVETDGGDIVFVATFPYHASFNDVENPDPYRTYGHTWNFIDPRNSDSNIGNCLIRNGIASFNTGETTGILSIGRYTDENSQFYHETQNREWTFSQRQTGSSGGGHDPYYLNVFDMEGDNADMIWETEGLWFDTGTNLSCIYNENDAVDDPFKTNPLNFVSPGSNDPDRYVGLLPVTDDKKSSFTIPGLKDGDRVLIFMKSGEGSGTNGIFLNITGAKDALGKKITTDENDPDTWYKAGGTNWQHDRYEGCYHFIKDGDGNMTFDMQSGSMCKLLYIRIYTGQRIVTTNIVSSATGDAGRLLFMNDKGAALGSDGQGSQFSLRFRGKGQHSTNQVLTYSGNLNAASFTGDNFKVTGAYSHLIDFKSKVGEIGMFRLRMNDIEYSSNYVADFCDRNFTVGYRDKVDSYPYTWDFTDIQGFSSTKMSDEANNYPIDAADNDAYGHEWDISLFDAEGNMKVNTGYDPITNNLIFSPHKIGNGNQLWAGDGVIPETRGLWFYSEDDSESGYTSEYSSSLYNDCLQITDEGIRFANVPDDEGKRVAWWNYKMVVPDVPADGAVYLRMTRDDVVSDDAKSWSDIDNADVPFVATRFKFASQSAKTEVFTTTEVKGNGDYAFYKVPNTTNEWILAVKNTTGNVEHLTFTLNGWVVKKVAVSTDPKTVNDLGYASESRDHEIDPELMGYMTGTGLTAYTVSEVTYGDNAGDIPSIKLKAVQTNNVIGSATHHDNNAYIIYNKDEAVNGTKAVKALDGGFHLFVPDMHDKTKMADGITDATDAQKSRLDVSGNGLRAWLPSSPTTEAMCQTYTYTTGTDGSITATGAEEGVGEYTTYVLSSKGTNTVTGQTETGVERFRRVKAGTKAGNNKAYLPLLTENVKPKAGASAKGMFAIVFVDEEEGTETTSLNGVESIERTYNDSSYYTLGGVKVQNPTKKGIYIKNGKKIIIK